MEQECKYCGRTIVRMTSVKQRLLSRKDSQYCSFTGLFLDNKTIRMRVIFSGVVLIGIAIILGVKFIPDLIAFQFPPEIHPILFLSVLGIGIFWLGLWYQLRYIVYGGIEEYIFQILCENPQKPVPMMAIITYGNLIDASKDDVHFVIDNLERKRIITRTPRGIVMRLYF